MSAPKKKKKTSPKAAAKPPWPTAPGFTAVKFGHEPLTWQITQRDTPAYLHVTVVGHAAYLHAEPNMLRVAAPGDAASNVATFFALPPPVKVFHANPASAADQDLIALMRVFSALEAELRARILARRA